MDIDTVAKIISKSQRPLEVRYYLITEEKNNIPKCYRRRTTLPFSWCLEREDGF